MSILIYDDYWWYALKGLRCNLLINIARSWQKVLTQLGSQRLAVALELMIGDGGLRFGNAATKHWPMTWNQLCWLHKTANLLNKVAKNKTPTHGKQNVND